MATIALLLTLLSPIRGVFPPFYYEEFNAVKRRLEAIPELKITGFWQHKDMVLEDCGFDVQIDGATTSITFFDRQDWVGLFKHIEGVQLSSSAKTVYVSTDYMQQHGLQVENLTDVLKNLPAVQRICLNAEGPEFERQRTGPIHLNWVLVTDESYPELE